MSFIAKLLSLYSRSALLVHGGNAHAAADAQRGQAVLGIGALLHLVQQRDDDTGTGSADGVAQGDGAAVDVDLAHVKAQLTGHGDGLGGERLVGLHRSISSMVTPALVMA